MQLLNFMNKKSYLADIVLEEFNSVLYDSEKVARTIKNKLKEKRVTQVAAPQKFTFIYKTEGNKI